MQMIFSQISSITRLIKLMKVKLGKGNTLKESFEINGIHRTLARSCVDFQATSTVVGGEQRKPTFVIHCNEWEKNL